MYRHTPALLRKKPLAGPQGKEYLADGSAYTLDGRGVSQCVASTSSEASHKQGVRRLTPLECERLQGFPDHYTAITHRGKPAADGPRYKALGNSMAVPVMRWIGERIHNAERALALKQLEEHHEHRTPKNNRQ